MHKTSIFTGIGGFALGCLTIFLYKHNEPTPAPVVASTPAPVAAKIVPAAKPAEPEAKPSEVAVSEPQISVSTSVNGLDNPEHKALLAQVGKTMKEQAAKKLQLRVDERLAALKAKLGLSDEQVAQMRPQVEGMLKEANPALFGEDGAISISMDNMKEKKQQAAAEKAKAEADLMAQLSPQQLAAYDGWKQEEKANRVEVKAGQDLASLQSQLSLTAEQKDAAFAAFSKLASTQGEQTDILSNPQGFMETRKARLEAMRPILTPEQMAVYERGAGGNVMSFSLGGADVDATEIVDSVVIDATTTSDATVQPAPAGK